MFSAKASTIIFSLFKFIGIFPYSIKLVKKANRTNLQLNHNSVFHFSKTLALLIITGYAQINLNVYKVTSSYALNELVFITCNFYIYIVLSVHYIYFALKKTKIKAIIELMFILSKCVKLENNTNKLSLIFICEMVILLILLIYILIIYYVNYTFNMFSLYITASCIPKLIIITITIYYCNYLLYLKEISFSIRSTLLIKREKSVLNYKMKHYFVVIKLVKKITRLFGYCTLLSLGQYSVWIIYETYHLTIILSYMDTSQKKYYFLILYATTWTIIQCGAVLFLIVVCTAVNCEIKKFIPEWIRACCKSDYKDIIWSVKILHHKVIFTAKDWFELDVIFAFKMLEIFITYITILTQFSVEVD